MYGRSSATYNAFIGVFWYSNDNACKFHITGTQSQDITVTFVSSAGDGFANVRVNAQAQALISLISDEKLNIS